jgi:2TM family of unknown function (DUF5676)
MAVMADTAAGVAVAIMIPSPQARTVCNALRNKGQVINIDSSDIVFLNRGNDMLNIKVVTWSLAIWTTFSFVFCVVYGLLTPSSMHMTAFLEQVLPGFEWLSWRGFLVGLIQSFLYGAYAGLVYVPIYNFLHRRWVRQWQ